MDDARLYNEVLNQTQIQALMQTPEPGTLALLLSGLGALLAYAWRKRRSA